MQQIKLKNCKITPKTNKAKLNFFQSVKEKYVEILKIRKQRGLNMEIGLCSTMKYAASLKDGFFPFSDWIDWGYNFMLSYKMTHEPNQFYTGCNEPTTEHSFSYFWKTTDVDSRIEFLDYAIKYFSNGES